MKKLLPADILLVDSGTSYCDMILAVLNLLQKDDVRFGHSILVINDDIGIEAASTIKYVNLREKFDTSKAYKIIRNKNISDAQRISIVEKAEKLFGLKYGYIRIFLQLLDNVFNTNFFTSIIKDKKTQICSTIISWAYYTTAKIIFNDTPWYSVEPDDIDDESIENVSDWETIVDTINR